MRRVLLTEDVDLLFLLKPAADLEIDTSMPVDRVVATILRHVRAHPAIHR